MTASPPSALPEPRHKPELDGIRGIAILAVLLSHGAVHIRPDVHVARLLIDLMIPGWSGVELFFALSGFLITGILLRTKRSPNYFSSFYMRRFLRIFPIYYLALTVGLIAAGFSPWWHSLMPELEKTRIAFYFYLQNCPLFWNHGQPLTGAFGHFWSLAVEEQFYLVWPVLIWLLPEKAVFRICCVGFLLALPLRILLFAKVFGANFALMQLTTSRVDGLFIGSAFAIRASKGPIPMRWISSALAIGALIIGYIGLFQTQELAGTNRFMHTIGVTGFALLSGGLIGLSQHRVQGLRRVLDMGWLRATGKYSYGMYVYHLPLYVVMDHFLLRFFGINAVLPLVYALPYIAFLLAGTYLIAKLSFDLFESRVLAWKKHFRPEAPVPRTIAEPVEAIG